MIEKLEKRGIPCIDLSDLGEIIRSNPLPFTTRDSHWNPNTHGIIAKKVYKLLEEHRDTIVVFMEKITSEGN